MPAACDEQTPNADVKPGPLSAIAEDEAPLIRTPPAAVAARLAALVGRRGGEPVLVLAASEQRADEIALALRAFAPEADTLVLSPWDTLPYDRASPTRACMGRRIATLARLAHAPDGQQIVVTSPGAIVQKVEVIDAVMEIRRGATLDRAELEQFLQRYGYNVDEKVEEPGDAALQGQVIDVFSADADQPVRLKIGDDGTINDLQTFDVITQRSDTSIDRLRVVPASEVVLAEDQARESGLEPRQPAVRSGLTSLFELLPDAVLVMEPDAFSACTRFIERAEEAYKTLCSFAGPRDIMPPQPHHLYLTSDELTSSVTSCTAVQLDLKGLAATPNFAIEKDVAGRFKAFVTNAAKGGARVAVVASEHEILDRMLRRLSLAVEPVEGWRDVLDAEPGSILRFKANLEAGFVDHPQKLVVATAADVFGVHAASSEFDRETLGVRIAPQPGDVVVHEDHGVAILSGLEEVTLDGGSYEMVRLTFHGDAKLLVPTEELDRIWRYGSEPDAVTLDRLHTEGWSKRRAKVDAFIEEAAARLVRLAHERAKAKTEPLRPDRARYARFAARFPFAETGDQSAAVQAVLDDLASGTPMNRLICGDVGYGKTEVALRAAAAVALSGKQVALITPTTVLARQHALSFKRRFADTGVEIVHLSRLVSPGDAKTAKKQLASGAASIAIGTQMIAAQDMTFADLSLVIVDEEHRFGMRTKEALQSLAPHYLALTATPIPRTLQGALVGVQDISIIAAPPARRRPVRTMQSAFDKATAATALIREKRRGGQSFVVVPRVEDIKPTRNMLAAIVPGFSIDVAHGGLPAEDADEAMVRFAEGGSDILLATTLIENGIDVPRANTILVWGADRFGLAQLHQLRGRVGRGRAQATAYLFIPDDAGLSQITAQRLAALLAADRLGAGFLLSARDLDLRGGGDLVGTEQAGHMKLIGASLYKHLLARAVRSRTQDVAAERRLPDLQVDGVALIPAAYVPDEALRLELYARLAHLEAVDAVAAFGEELSDRFGGLPSETERLLARRRVVVVAHAAGAATVTIGALSTALSFFSEAAARLRHEIADPQFSWKDERLIIQAEGTSDMRLASVEEVLSKLAAPRAAVSQAVT